jgi:hypothetical protein
MQRTKLFDFMGKLKLNGMKAAFDGDLATAVNSQHEPQHIVSDLLTPKSAKSRCAASKARVPGPPDVELDDPTRWIKRPRNGKLVGLASNSIRRSSNRRQTGSS